MSQREKTQMKIRCPSCSTKLDVTDLSPFTVFPCPKCGYKVTVPMRFQAYALEEYLESAEGIHRYRALDEKLDREACVVMCDASDAHPWQQLERYLEMVRKASTVSHPGLAAIYSCGRYETGVYAACQLLAEPIRDGLYAPRMGWSMARPILLSLTEALQKSAEAGALHGALNSRSFRKDAVGVPKVYGFGEGVLLTGKMAEDPFAAPERKEGDECSVAADLYSFGVWALGLLTGCSPHEIANGTIAEPPSDVPAGVFAVLRQMVSASPFKRPMGYLDLLAELKGEGRSAAMKNWKRGGEATFKERPSAPKGVSMATTMSLCLVVLLVGTIGGWAFRKWRDEANRQDRVDHQTSQSHSVVAMQGGTSAENVGKATAADHEGKQQDEAEVAQLPKEYRRLRPKPEDLKFDEEAIRNYLRAIPSEFAAVEKDRAERMMGLRDYLFASLRMPYRPPKSEGLRLRDGSLLRGFIPMGTEASGLTVRPFDDVRQNLLVTNLKLEELAWSEIWGMLDYYGKIREDMGDSESQKGLFEHYLSSAVACDWYGYRKEAVSFARKALKVNPKGRAIMEQLGFGRELSKNKE